MTEETKDKCAGYVETLVPYKREVVFPCRLKNDVPSRRCRQSVPMSDEERASTVKAGRLFSEGWKLLSGTPLFYVTIKPAGDKVLLLENPDDIEPVAICLLSDLIVSE